jgi:hypothetical protein
MNDYWEALWGVLTRPEAPNAEGPLPDLFRTVMVDVARKRGIYRRADRVQIMQANGLLTLRQLLAHTGRAPRLLRPVLRNLGLVGLKKENRHAHTFSQRDVARVDAELADLVNYRDAPSAYGVTRAIFKIWVETGRVCPTYAVGKTIHGYYFRRSEVALLKAKHSLARKAGPSERRQRDMNKHQEDKLVDKPVRRSEKAPDLQAVVSGKIKLTKKLRLPYQGFLGQWGRSPWQVIESYLEGD